MIIECPRHEGAFDCTPFCELCEGNQEIKECVRNHEWIGTPQYCSACGVDKGNEREN